MDKIEEKSEGDIPVDSELPVDCKQAVGRKRPPLVFLVVVIPLIPIVILGFIVGIISKPFSIGYRIARRM